MTNFLLIGFSAAIGAWLRWLIGAGFAGLFPGLPFGTLAVKPAPISQRSQAPIAAENPMRRKLVILNFNKVFAVIF
jgi:hypothetical protein